MLILAKIQEDKSEIESQASKEDIENEGNFIKLLNLKYTSIDTNTQKELIKQACQEFFLNNGKFIQQFYIQMKMKKFLKRKILGKLLRKLMRLHKLKQTLRILIIHLKIVKQNSKISI